MKANLLWALFLACCLFSCNEDPDICLERAPIPVIYSVFNKYDSINYLYVTKTWSGDNGGSLVTAKNPDSIYFKNVTVRMDLIRNFDSVSQQGPDTIQVVPDFEMIHDKKPGYFIYPDCPVFALHYNLEDFDILISHISIPGYDPIVLTYDLLAKPVFYSPGRDGMSLEILPKKGLAVKYSGIGIFELRLFFEVITKSETGFTSDTVLLEKWSSGSPTTLTYGNLLSALNLQLKVRPGIEYRKFGKVNMEIWVAKGSFPWLNKGEVSSAYIDFTLPGSPWIPARFVYGGSIATNHLSNLSLDDQTREAIAGDTSLAKFRFVKW